MRNILLSSLSILGGITTVHAQHWVPYGFYAFKQSPQKTPTPAVAEEPVIEEANEGLVAENSDQIFAYYDNTDPGSIFYLDPDVAYQKNKAPKVKKPPKERVPRSSKLCTENFWIEGDYLLAWMRNGDIDSPLITTGSAADAVPGAIGQPNTTVVFGDHHYNYHRSSGVRAAIGGYMGVDRALSFDVDAFWIFAKEKHFNISSDVSGSPLIARPFFDVSTGTENAELVSNPGLFSGTSSGLVKTQLWGGEFNIGYHPCKNTSAGDLFIGFRYLRLFEKIRIKDEMLPLAGGVSGLTFNGATHAVDSPDSLMDEDVFRSNTSCL